MSIVGIGKHSRGQASLPLAVKTFFEDNRWRSLFDLLFHIFVNH